MKDLLPDNVTARENAQPQSPNQPRQREIKSVLTWISAFITYTAIRIPCTYQRAAGVHEGHLTGSQKVKGQRLAQL